MKEPGAAKQPSLSRRPKSQPTAKNLNTEANKNEAMLLPAILDLKAATPLYQMFTAQRGTDLRVSGAQVQRLGAQCLQVLLSAQAAWLADGKVLTIADPSTELANSVELFGLDDPAAVFGGKESA